ncbi:MAG: 7-cyano-7-deazaguanine synthase QueC, partial [Candidatus Hydrogenedentes bacterium]|nr:7-cyano-7-deazaguanine synthase QueC [Candidatus Hydrogenedentota bacterium]
MSNKKKQYDAVVLVSGGIDSTVLLHQLCSEYTRIAALCIHYGQRHKKEMECARFQSNAVQEVSFRSLDMGGLGDFLKETSSLICDGVPVPDLNDLSSSDREQPSTYVPNRNMILLSVAAAYAESISASHVFYGAQAQDEYGYWDCTVPFLEGINATLALNRRNAVVVKAPLIHNSKADNVRMGFELGVDFSHTWSCYRGEEKACGTCPTCVERLKAF